MEIYRVTVERTFSDEVLQSHFFATEQAALGYAEMLKDEIEQDFDDNMIDIIVAAYTPDDGGEFFFDHEIKTYEL